MGEHMSGGPLDIFGWFGLVASGSVEIDRFMGEVGIMAAVEVAVVEANMTVNPSLTIDKQSVTL